MHFHARLVKAVFALASALAGCGSGCHGEGHQLAASPGGPPQLSSVPPGSGDANDSLTGEPPVAPRPPADAAVILPGYLDAPAGSLEALFTGLAAAEAARADRAAALRPPSAPEPDRADPTSRVLWLFFGDSHTAGDSMTARLRQALQAKFGDAGRGLVAAGKPPTRHYYQRDVRYGGSTGWKAAVGGKKGDPEPYGIAGLRVYGQTKGSSLWVETCGECSSGRRTGEIEILYYAAPDRGAIRYRVDDAAWQTLKTRTTPIEPPHPARQVILVPDGPHRLSLEHGGGGPVDLFGVVLERLRPGVIVDSLGVVGRRLGSLRSWDWAVIGDQLASRDPRLVVLQYGTNEADDPNNDIEAMGRYFDETILRIRAAAPTASILILGPPDMAVREAGKACDRLPPFAALIPECEWRTPHVLIDIISAQHAAARRNRVAFFDTFAAMGGADHMDGWFLAEPKLAYKDHVHLTDLGYQQWADALLAGVLADYGAWRQLHGLPATPAADAPLVAPVVVPPAPPQLPAESDDVLPPPDAAGSN